MANTRSKSKRGTSPEPTPHQGATVNPTVHIHASGGAGKGSKGHHSQAAPTDSGTYGGNAIKTAAEKPKKSATATPSNNLGAAILGAATRGYTVTQQSGNQVQAQPLATDQDQDDTLAQEAHTVITAPVTVQVPEHPSAENHLAGVPGVPTQGDNTVEGPASYGQCREQSSYSNDNQPLGRTSALHRQFTLSNSDSSIDRPLVSFFNGLHYTGFALFLLALVLIFADIYRGPLLGSRFDLLKSRHSVGNHSTILPSELSALEQRMTAIEHGLGNQIDVLKYELHSQPMDLHKISKGKINFFSHLHGVAVNYHLTSPTNTVYTWCDEDEKADFPKTLTLWHTHVHHSLTGICSKSITAQAPATVFGPWDESEGPSWCAAAGDAVLQLATAVKEPMTPTELVVEYNPNSKQIDPVPVPAPKEVELWMSVLDDALRESIGQDFEALYGLTQEPTKALPHEYVPIGRWTYDFHSLDYLQTFKVHVNLKGATTGNLVVRVNSNWAGALHTCLYRLRLHGLPGAKA
ncbi:MAG: hypothetical protein Q9166_003892 [cf. Caloplaca sp. 2 TL-2023]